MTTTLTIILYIFLYLIVGRIYTNLMKSDEYENAVITIFYPIIIVWKIAMSIADNITNILFKKSSKDI
jgi:hypothetical protein